MNSNFKERLDRLFAESLENKIYRYSKETYNILKNKYFKEGDKLPQYIIKLCEDDFPSDKNEVPACTMFTGDNSDRTTYLTEDFVIYFNLPLLRTEFKDYVKLICIHEMCHVFCDVLTKKWNIKQSENDHKGHPRLFFQLMNLFKLKDYELKLQRIRHELPYNFGYPDIINFSTLYRYLSGD